jgi:hypothetical protein
MNEMADFHKRPSLKDKKVYKISAKYLSSASSLAPRGQMGNRL